MEKEVKFEVFAVFGFAAANYALELARKNDLGAPLEFKSEDENKEFTIAGWYLECENGRVLSKGW